MSIDSDIQYSSESETNAHDSDVSTSNLLVNAYVRNFTQETSLYMTYEIIDLLISLHIHDFDISFDVLPKHWSLTSHWEQQYGNKYIKQNGQLLQGKTIGAYGC